MTVYAQDRRGGTVNLTGEFAGTMGEKLRSIRSVFVETLPKRKTAKGKAWEYSHFQVPKSA